MRLIYEGEPMFHAITGYSLQPGEVEVGDEADARALVEAGICRLADGEAFTETGAPEAPPAPPLSASGSLGGPQPDDEDDDEDDEPRPPQTHKKAPSKKR